MSVAARLSEVLERIRRAREASARAAASVRLIAVSKTQPPEAIREAYAAGQRDFGENYAQELASKALALADLEGLRWHMIGHLQRNKASKLLPHLGCLQTLDSVALTRELGKRRAASAAGPEVPLEVLVEVAIAGEAQKSGVAIADLGSLLEAVERESSLKLMGLMCVPPASSNPEAARPHFDALRRLRDEHGGARRLPELSMGMSFDLEAAIAAGATLVRVGTAIFGSRDAPPA